MQTTESTYYLLLLTSKIFFKKSIKISDKYFYHNFINYDTNKINLDNSYHIIQFKMTFLDIIYNDQNDLYCLYLSLNFTGK